VEHCAFDLHPGIPLEGQPIPWPPERMAAARSRFEQVASAEGLSYGARTHWFNSGPAHQAAIWADQTEHSEDFRSAVYQAYFVDNHNIADADVLAGIAERLDLDTAELRQALAEERFRSEVERQFEYAREVGVSAVPAYIAGRYLLVGAQPFEVYRQLIETAQAEDGGLTTI
jgi:predicted DsbA family dithiol-disulfide isomerase